MSEKEKTVDQKYFDTLVSCINQFNRLYPDVKLDNLENLGIKESEEIKVPVKYDFFKHIISISKDIKVEELEYYLTREIVKVVATNRKLDVTGLNAPGIEYDSIGYGISEGICENITKSIVPSFKDEYFSTGVLSNLIMMLTSSEDVLDAYFNNDSNKFISLLESKLGSKEDSIMLLKAISSETKNALEGYKEQDSILGEIEFSLLSKYFDNNEVTSEELEDIFVNIVCNDEIMESDKFNSVNDVETLINREKRKLDLKEMVDDVSSVVDIIKGEVDESRSIV